MAVKLSQEQIARVEMAFIGCYHELGTEDRILIYCDEAGALHAVWPSGERSRGHVRCDVPLTIEHDGRLWDLAFDLHSHHEMGAFWSLTDNDNERIRGPVFGVCAWVPFRSPPQWLFRRFTGKGPSGYEAVSYGEVVADG